jgi:hypothetical protein
VAEHATVPLDVSQGGEKRRMAEPFLYSCFDFCLSSEIELIELAQDLLTRPLKHFYYC